MVDTLLIQVAAANTLELTTARMALRFSEIF